MPETIEQTSPALLVAVLRGRSDFYLALAGFYFKPLTQEQIDAMAQTDYTEFGAGEPLLEEGFNDITRYLRKRNTGTRQALAVDFTSSFGGAQAYSGKTAVPYASVFLSEEGLLSQKPRADAFQVFKRNALRVADTGTPDDHLSIMLEFLAVMSERAAVALEGGRVDDAVGCLIESRSFIDGQVLTWFTDLAELANKLLETRFYRGVLKVTEAYLRMDRQTLDDLLEELSELSELSERASSTAHNG
ncbi:MAG: molecular chaperone TorD family protein [Coriobacteriales bacterium]|jgi:TorA maturation chaperone TorD|nr:molecular chaperone TorD family protein [Coriobacteriales bacterium]